MNWNNRCNCFSSTSDIDGYLKVRMLMEEEAKAKKDKEKKKPEAPKVTLFSAFLFCMAVSPFAGYLTLKGIVVAYADLFQTLGQVFVK